MVPIFPLEIVVFPNEPLNLHIFEPRYKELVEDCMAKQTPFAIFPYIKQKLMPVGTQMFIRSIEKTYDDGRMDIKCVSEGLYNLLDTYKPYPSKLYSGAKVSKRPMKFNDASQKLSIEIINKLGQIFEILNINKKLKPAELFNSYQVGHYLGFNLEEEYELLSIQSEFDRQIHILRQIDRILPNLHTTQLIKKKALLNGEFRNLKPPQI